MDLKHLHLHTRDRRAAERFYLDWLGLTVARREEGLSFLTDTQGFDLALMDDPAPQPLPAWFHFGSKLASADEVQALYERMRRAGLPMRKPLYRDDTLALFRVEDPDGHSIEIYWEGTPDEASGPPAERLRVAALTAADVERYRALMLHAYAAAPDAFTSTAAERAAEPLTWWLSRIADPKGTSQAFGAFIDGELVGTVTLEFATKPKTRHKAHLVGMFVHEAARGLGAGRALLQAALAAAAARPGVRVVTLTVTEGNRPAIALYEASGFSTFGVEPMALHMAQGFKAKVHMWLALPDGGAP